MFGPGVPRARHRCCAATPRRVMAPSPGAASAGSRPGSRPAAWASTSAVVTNLAAGSAEWLYDTLYCARGQAENLVKLHKGQLASDRTSCRSPLANQVRLVLHTAAYWPLLTLRDRVPRPHELSRWPKVLQQASQPEPLRGHGSLATRLLWRRRQSPGGGSGGPGVDRGGRPVRRAETFELAPELIHRAQLGPLLGQPQEADAQL